MLRKSSSTVSTLPSPSSEEDPAAKLLALMEASLDSNVTEPRKMAVWYAFSAEARSRKDYQRICGTQDQKILNLTHQFCREIIRKGEKDSHMNALAMANAVQGLVDEIWQGNALCRRPLQQGEFSLSLPLFSGKRFSLVFCAT